MIQLACGEVLLHWLTPKTLISEAELELGVHPSEWQEAHGWPAKVRRDEYLRARWLLRRLSGYREQLGKTAAGAPLWPPGWVGSLTHKSGFVGLALEASSDWLSLGIDAEEPTRMRLDFASRLADPSEDALLRQLAGGDDERLRFLLTVLFSFKESLFKALFPLGETMFYFHDAQITAIDQASGRLSVRLKRPVSPWTPAGSTLTGSYRAFASEGRTFVLTSIGVARTTSGGTGNDNCG